MATTLSGVSGAFYYKPAGTQATFASADVTVAGVGADFINVGANFNFKAGDPVKFRLVNTQTGGSGTGTLPAPLSAATTYYVISYNNSTGAMQISATLGGVALEITDVGTAASPNKFEIYYADFAAVAEVRDWTLEISRSDIDCTTIGQTLGQYVPFRKYISGFGDATGSATVYMTDEESGLANRLVQDVLLRKRAGASVKLYIERIEAAGVINEAKSRSIDMEVSLTSAGLNINPDDAVSVSINFRPAANVNFDFATT
ncbi:MAG: hypothetical protein EBW87_00705 [Burkholderiaceae bacterium]|nr:hypothetical protein [Burkholderiaceae bacterium]